MAWFEATADYRLLVTGGGGVFPEPRAWMAGIRGPGRVVPQG